jgi:hypothetical protein
MNRPWMRALLVAIAVALAVILAGCGARINIMTCINKDETGYREMTAYVSNSDLNELKGGQAALDQILKSNLPDSLSLNIQPDATGVLYTMRIEFTSIDELREKSTVVLGRDSGIEGKLAGTPFNRTFTYRENANPKEYFNWAVNAVKSAGLTTSDSLVESTKGSFILPSGNEKDWDPYNDTLELSDGYSYPVKQLVINSDFKNMTKPRRSIDISLDETAVNAINSDDGDGDKVMDYFKEQLGNESNIARRDTQGLVTYTIHLNSDFDRFQKLSRKIFPDESLSYKLMPDCSKLFPLYYFHDSFNPANFFGSKVEILEPIEYSIVYPADPVDNSGNKLRDRDLAGKKERIAKFQPGEQINIEAYFKKTSTWLVAVVGGYGLLIILLAVGSFRAFIGLQRYCANHVEI